MNVFGFGEDTSMGKLIKVRTLLNKKFNNKYDPNIDEMLVTMCKDLRVEIIVIKTGELTMYCARGVNQDGR